MRSKAEEIYLNSRFIRYNKFTLENERDIDSNADKIRFIVSDGILKTKLNYFLDLGYSEETPSVDYPLELIDNYNKIFIPSISWNGIIKYVKYWGGEFDFYFIEKEILKRYILGLEINPIYTEAFLNIDIDNNENILS